MSFEDTAATLGNEPPLVAGGRGKPPDAREVSIRWLSGTFLTGFTSCVLMGGALLATLDDRQALSPPREFVEKSPLGESTNQPSVTKTGRLLSPRILSNLNDTQRFDISTITPNRDGDLVRTTPFLRVSMTMAAGHSTSRSYAPFNPLELFDEEPELNNANTGNIYGARVESEVRLRVVDFPLASEMFDDEDDLATQDIELEVRNIAAVLTDGDVQVTALQHVDPQRFGEAVGTSGIGQSYGIRIVPENMSVAVAGDSRRMEYVEDVIPFATDRGIDDALAQAGYIGERSSRLANILMRKNGSPILKGGSLLRLGIELRQGSSEIVRASVYSKSQHVFTVALNDRQQLVDGREPQPNATMAAAIDTTHQPTATEPDKPPALYDGIYRAAFAHGLTRPMTRQLVRILGTTADLKSPLNPSDKIEVFFSQPDDEGKATNGSELLFVKADFDGVPRTFYRYQASDGTIGYFDENGRSARQFLLRNPIPDGRFTSGFGKRRHPVLGYTRPHTGIDWAAPRGTPIIAPGDGVVEKAGWNGGYGRQTVIRHANGYQTTFNHQSKIAEGVLPGERIRQGQIIGYVGSTGLSTGNHLHYELIVNGSKVDPMRVRLPDGQLLSKSELEKFLLVRKRIDSVLSDRMRRDPEFTTPV